ncbi:MAG: nitrilase, partial [Prolixibacteraceae bacterium]|nr:nitrilase [Prolixibacteraceae bacterium]
PVGYDGEHLKNGNSMILDPYGEVLSEIKSFHDDIAVATLVKDKIQLSGGFRYTNARRPELYRHIIGKEHTPQIKPVWMQQKGN